MKTVQGITIDPKVFSALGLDNLMLVMTRQVTQSKAVLVNRFKKPAQDLFNGAASISAPNTADNNSQVITFSDGRTFLIEPQPGAKYRMFNTTNRKNSSMCYILVPGASYEFYSFIPQFTLQQMTPNTVRVINTCLINGKNWDQVQGTNNRDIGALGCMWQINNTTAGMDTSRFITNGTKFDFNRGSGRLFYADISKAPGETTDYVWSAADQTDIDIEQLSLVLYIGVKDTTYPMRMSLADIFANANS
jgi:hypothetical protein